MNFNLFKKILFTTMIFVFFLKFVDLIFQKFIGLGNPLIYQHSKIFGYDIEPNQKIKRRGKSITINDFGMRNIKNWNDDYNKKILFLGDSVTFGGSLINDEETFVLQTCNKFKDLKIICGNHAINGYGVESISNKLEFKEFSDEDFLVFVFIGNNFERGLNHIGVQPYFSKKINRFFPALTELTMIAVDKIRNFIRFDFNNLSENQEIYYDYQLKQIYNLKNILEKNNKNYYIFYSPEYTEFKNVLKYQHIKKIFSEEFVNFFDLTEDLERYKEKIFYDNVHLNKFGHKIYSKLIYDKIYNEIKN